VDNQNLLEIIQVLGTSNKFFGTFASFPDATTASQTKLYVDKLNGIIYRNDGTSYIAVSSSASGLNYKGSWDSLGNTPTIVSGIGIAGEFYKVSVPSTGVTTIDGESTWTIDDQISFNGTIWQRIPNTNIDNTPVELSVNTTITQLDTVYLVNTSVSDVTITIPDAIVSNGGKEVQVIKNSGDFNVLVETVSSQDIGTLTTQTISKTSKGLTMISRGGSNSYAITQDSRSSFNIVEVTANETVSADHNTILANGTFTITLPTTIKKGFRFDIKNIGTGIITLFSSVNIDDTSTKTINVQYDAYTIQWDGVQWWII